MTTANERKGGHRPLTDSSTAAGDDGAIDWESLRDAAAACTRCPLYRGATQTVFGEGPRDAALMLMGEQPGDHEDLAGHPFVGPAGQLLDKALSTAGIARGRVYVTNAVKHFKFVRHGRRRIHARPDAGEIEACRWWYAQERTLVRPAMTIALGATAARQMLGRSVTIGAARGRPWVLSPDGGLGWVTVHPSFLLRQPDRAARAAEMAAFVADLRAAAAAADSR